MNGYWLIVLFSASASVLFISELFDFVAHDDMLFQGSSHDTEDGPLVITSLTGSSRTR